MGEALWDLLRGDGRFAFGFTVLALLAALAALSLASPYDPRAWDVVPKDLPPSLAHPLGTTSTGQDLFWTISVATRNSLLLGLLTACLSIAIGTFVGLVAGYRGGWIDNVLMAVNDSFIVLPGLPILILLSTLFKERLTVPLLAVMLSLFSWPWGGRQVRAMVLSLREREFTLTARYSGMSTLKTVLGEHLPFVTPWVMANFINTILWAIGMETTLAIFGLSSLETPTIGTTLYWALQYQAVLRGMLGWVLSPVAVAVLLFVALYMVSVSLSTFLDPRTRLQRMRMEEKEAGV